MFQLIDLIEHWATKTYEGKTVPFAFLIDKNGQKGNINFLEFFEEEYSATFSDGINSIIELDTSLNFVKHNSITANDIFLSTEINQNMPYRFAQVMSQFTRGKGKVALFLLSNGDLIVVQDAKIKLVKREGKWHNFDSDVFVDFISNILVDSGKVKIEENVLNSIFATSLDVSFAHSGGIIAVTCEEEKLVENNKYDLLKEKYIELYEIWSKNKEKSFSKYFDNHIHSLTNRSEFSIIDFIDYLPKNGKLDNLIIDFPEYYYGNNSNLTKRLLKRSFLLELIGSNPFYKIDRKLRTELVSMDGATIIDEKGKVIAVGAIIQNDSGSYGGGRGAATRKLSNYGIAVKISTDGYIEVYHNGRIIYKIK